MGDLAARPRGGWQYGNARRRPTTSDDGVPRLPNGKVDDAPDCYAVTRPGPGVFHVKHYPHAGATTACCAMEITRSARDIEAAKAEGIDVDIVTLRRAPDCMKTKAK